MTLTAFRLARTTRERLSSGFFRMTTRSEAVVFAVMLAGCSGENSEPVMSREELLKPETCKKCHEKHYEQWAGSMHAYAAQDPIFLAMNARGQRETGGKLGKFCVNCHAPLAVSEGALTDFTKVEDAPKYLKGVTCYFCHNVESVEGTHNNPLVLANDETMRGPIGDPVKNTAHHSEYSELLDNNAVTKSSKLCGTCHDLVVPKSLTGGPEDVHLERTYEEYQNTRFNSDGPGGLSCGSSCHMYAEGLQAIADFKGVKTRIFHEHRFPGLDTAITDFPDRDEQKAEVQRLVNNIRARLCVTQTGGIKVTLDNTGAAHNFPSGASQDRRMWTEVISYDDSDNVLYSSGVVADDQAVTDLADPDLWLLRDKTFGADGNPAHMFWDVTRVETTTAGFPSTIPGFRTTDPTAPGFLQEIEYHEYKQSGGTGLPARVTLRVRVRAMDLDVIDDLIASGDLSADYRQSIPTFDINPKNDPAGILLEFTSADFMSDIQETVLGLPGACVETNPSTPQ